MDENGFKTLETLQDELGHLNLNYLSYHRLIKSLLQFKARNQGKELNLQGVRIPVDKHGRTPFDYIPRVVEAIKRIKKGSLYYRRIHQKQMPKEITT